MLSSHLTAPLGTATGQPTEPAITWQPIQCTIAADEPAENPTRQASAKGHDGDRPADDRDTRFYVGVSMPGSLTCGVSDHDLTRLKDYVAGRIEGLDGVALVPAAAEAPPTATSYYLLSTVLRLEEREDEVRATVSLMLASYPGHEMRSVLRGEARMTGPHAARTGRVEVLRRPVESALRRLPEAMRASAPQLAHAN